LEEIERQRSQAQELTEAERVRAEDYVRAVEAGQAPYGPTPKGVDPARVARARLARARARHDDAVDSQARADAAKAIRRAQKALEQAETGGAEPAGDRDRITKATQKVLDRTVQANTTDPDSRLMAGSNGGSIQGFNAQIAVTDDHLILAAELTQQANDVESFESMMNAAIAAAARVVAAQPKTPDDKTGKERPDRIGLIVADAGYLSNDNLTATGPDRLIALGKNRDLHRDAKAHPTSGPPPEDTTAIEQMRHRLRTPEGVRAYKRRGATVEPVNGHIKDRIGLRRFSRRGLRAATSELHLAAAVVNMLRLHGRTSPAPA
jgi:hypothetical protein